MLKKHWFMIPCRHKNAGIMTSEPNKVTCKSCLRIMRIKNIKKDITQDILKAASPL